MTRAHGGVGVDGHAPRQRLHLFRRELVALHVVPQPPVPAIACAPNGSAVSTAS